MILLANILDILTAVFAIIAAVLWLKSAKIKTPENFSIYVVKPNQTPLGGNPMGGTYLGNAYSQDLTELAIALKKQSKLSANAASFAALSAMIQALSILTKHFV
jgi:hypothetical protein